MHWRVEPPIEQWRPADRAGVIATGHQPWFWHPGILAKDIAMHAACDRLGASPLHVVVDHDAHDALTLALPRVDGARLSSADVRLAPQQADTPTGYQSVVDADAVVARLCAIDDPRLKTFIEAWRGLPECRTLAQQIAAVISRLREPYVGETPTVFVSEMIRQDAFRRLVDDVVSDARACVASYNAAVREHREAGVGPLTAGRELIELPLWAVRWNSARRRVYADVADRQPLLVFDDGQPVDRDIFDIAPRALILSAAMRAFGCDLFIHGAGGGVYDRATEAWWAAWRGEPLAPMAVATADLHLDFDAPVADTDELRRAVWRRHHLPHNVDRALGAIDPRKRTLLERMDDDRDRRRRRAAFERLHAINDELAAAHPELIAEARRGVDRARIGVENQRLARRRDWCFALYPPAKLRALIDAIRQPVIAGRR